MDERQFIERIDNQVAQWIHDIIDKYKIVKKYKSILASLVKQVEKLPKFVKLLLRKANFNVIFRQNQVSPGD